jgi:hypothetical protein
MVRIPNQANPFVIYVDPVPHLAQSETVFEQPTDFAPWMALIAAGLKYDPAMRPSPATFAAEIASRLRDHPPTGLIQLSLAGHLMIDQRADGSPQVARVLKDIPRDDQKKGIRYRTHLLL